MQKSYLPHSNPASKKVAPGKLPSVRWRHYDRLPAGEYTAYCRRALTYYDSGFKRFTCLLLWDVLSPEGESIGRVRQWLNLGSKARPRATRRSRYWAAWIAANDGKPPLRSDRLSPEIFNHRVARVVVADSASQPPYSVVREVIRWETGFPKKQSQSRSKTQSLNYSTKAWKKPSVKKKLAIGDVSKKTS